MGSRCTDALWPNSSGAAAGCAQRGIVARGESQDQAKSTSGAAFSVVTPSQDPLDKPR